MYFHESFLFAFCLFFLPPFFFFFFCTRFYDIKYSNIIQIIYTQLYGFKYSYLILTITSFQVIISFDNRHLFAHSYGFGWLLWHINHCRLFNAISSLYIYIKYIWFGFVGFYSISTIVGYLMPNPLYTYILDI